MRVHYSFQQQLNSRLIVLLHSLTFCPADSFGLICCPCFLFSVLPFLFSFSARVRSFLIFSANGTQDGQKQAFSCSVYNFPADGQTDGNGAILERLTDCGRADLRTVCGAADRSRSRSRTDQADGTDPEQIADGRDGLTNGTDGTDGTDGQRNGCPVCSC